MKQSSLMKNTHRKTGIIRVLDKTNLCGRIINQQGSVRFNFAFNFSQITNLNLNLLRTGLQVVFNPVYRKNLDDQLIIIGAKEILIHYPVDDILGILDTLDSLSNEDEKKFESTQSELTSETLNSVSNPKYLESVALALFGDKIKIISLMPDGEYKFLDEKRTYHNIVYPSLFEEYTLEIAIEEFEDLINSTKTSENDIQRFLERNPKFLVSDQYVSAHPHINLINKENEILIPDFVLQPINQNSFCDLLELKLPTAKSYVLQKNRERFSASVAEAAAQLRVYSKFFDEKINRSNFQTRYPHLKIYKPKMFVIIGRRENKNLMAQQEIMASNPSLILRTYDEILDHIKLKKEFLQNKNKFFK